VETRAKARLCYHRVVSEPAVLSRFSVVLWRPKSPGNVGSVARAMRNMGFGTLRIADPMRYDDPSFFVTESRRMAWGAAPLIAAREEFPTIEAALADATLVAGTTSLPPARRTALSPRDLAPRLLDAAATGPVALLFGQEDIGLTHEGMARCQLLGTIPTSDAHASLNLAQAVLVFLYEIRIAALARATGLTASLRRGAAHRSAEDEPPAQADIEGFHRRLADALDSIGFFAGSRRASKLRELRSVLGPALVTRRNLRLLEGLARRMARGRPRG
jgi:TrmH family RNA methyltransferase